MAVMIKIAKDIDANDVIQIAVRADNSVSYETINAMFPGLSLLKYKETNTNAWIGVEVVNKDFKPLYGDTWHSDVIYIPVFPAPASSTPTSTTTSVPICARTFAFEKKLSMSQRLYYWLTGETNAHTKLE